MSKEGETPKKEARPQARAESPCISVCTMDERYGWCAGCFRTLDEITHWAAMTEEQKRAVLRELELRKLQRLF